MDSSRQYAADGGMYCPSCGECGVETGPDGEVYYDGETVKRAEVCTNCRTTWTAVFQLTGYEELKEDPAIQAELKLEKAYNTLRHKVEGWGEEALLRYIRANFDDAVEYFSDELIDPKQTGS